MTIVKKSKKKTLAPRVAKAFSEAAASKTTMENPEKPPTVQFLLTEYNALVEVWKQTDARIETAINFYLTICALVFPGLGLLYQALQSFQLFILASIGVATVTVAFGFLLVQRITGAQFNKSEYRLGMQIIRRYFVDNDPEIAKYLYMPIGPSMDHPHEVKKYRSFYVHKNLVRAINTFNSLLAGGIFGCITWLGFGNLFSLPGLVLIGFGFSIITFIMLNWLFWRRIKRLTI